MKRRRILNIIIVITVLTPCLLSSCRNRYGTGTGNSGMIYSYEKEINKIISRECRSNDVGPWSVIAGSGFNTNFYNKSVMAIFEEPLSLPRYTMDICNRLTGTGSRTGYLNTLHILSGISAGGYGPPLSGSLRSREFISPDITTSRVLERLAAPQEEGGIGLILNSNQSETFLSYPVELQKAILELLTSTAGINSLYKSFLPGEEYYRRIVTDKNNPVEIIDALNQVSGFRELGSNDHKQVLGSADRQILAFSSRLLSESIDRAFQYLNMYSRGQGLVETGLKLESQLGRIGIFTEKNDTVKGNYFLLIDLGGDDFYHSDCATAIAYNNPLSIHIDMDGDDQYGSPGSNSLVCSSVFGISFLIDRSGNDEYICDRYGPCFSFGGFACLEDSEGDDSYINRRGYSQGSSVFGYSLLDDRSGSDKYIAGSYSQGFAALNGVGVLIDKLGDDLYLASDASFCQGASKGRWADGGDGFNIGGGYGILADMDGKDKYIAQSFSQGASYYFGCGILYDLKGQDTYKAISHSQGSASHYSLACLIDESGDDHYNPESDQSQISQITGYARDHSIAAVIDLSGSDEYHFGNKSFGVGDINSIGIAIDNSGDDQYSWHRNGIYDDYESFGSGQGLGKSELSINRPYISGLSEFGYGIAIDGSGRDKYKQHKAGIETVTFARNSRRVKRINGNFLSIRTDKL